VAPIRWWAQTLIVVLGLIWTGLLLLTAAFVHAKGPVGVAFDVAIGTTDPFASHGADQEAVALAAFSWLLVPATVGTIAALVVQALLLRARPYSKDDWTTQIDELREEIKAFRQTQVRQAQTEHEALLRSVEPEFRPGPAEPE